MKNTIFEISMIPQTLNIKNYRTKSAKSINLHIIRKLIKYFLKKGLVKATVSLTQIISRRQKMPTRKFYTRFHVGKNGIRAGNLCFSKYSIKRCCKQINSIQKRV